MIRNIVSVIVGYVLWTVIFLGGAAGIRAANPTVHDEAGITTDPTTLSVYLLISFMASVVAGFATAHFASQSKMLCATILAICLLATGIPVQLSAWDQLPVWYNVVFLVMLVPITIVGAKLALGKSRNPAVRIETA